MQASRPNFKPAWGRIFSHPFPASIKLSEFPPDPHSPFTSFLSFPAHSQILSSKLLLFSRHPSSSDWGQSSSLGGLLWDKSLLQSASIALLIFSWQQRMVSLPAWGLAFSQTLYRVPSTIFKKNQLQGKRFVEFFLLHILLVSYHFAPTLDGGSGKQRHCGTTRDAFKGDFSLMKEINSLFKKRPNHVLNSELTLHVPLDSASAYLEWRGRDKQSTKTSGISDSEKKNHIQTGLCEWSLGEEVEKEKGHMKELQLRSRTVVKQLVCQWEAVTVPLNYHYCIFVLL